MKPTRITTAIFAVAFVALAASDLAAQQGGRQGRRGGFGGGGPGGRGGDPTMGLLRVDEVKAELGITPEQDEALQKLAEQSRSARPAGGGLNFRDMSEEERKAAFEKLQTELAARAKETKEKLEEVLLPDQIERLDQISLQVRGARALNDPEVREQLKVSPEQVAKLAEVRESTQTKMREKMQELFQSGDRTGMREAFDELRKEVDQETLGVLNEDQRAQFEKMKGEPFEMPDRGFGRGGPGRGPGSGGPGSGGRRRGPPDSSNE